MEDQFMNNITKNLLLGLTLVCVIALIVFCIQLIVLNRGVQPADPGTNISGGSQQSGAAAGSDPDDNVDGSSAGEDGDGITDDDGDTGTTVQTPRPPPQGTQRSLPVTADSRLTIYSRDELFEFVQGDLDWWFIYNGDGEATLEIAFTMVTTAQGAAAHAETFLNNYTGGTASMYSGEEYIQGSTVRGYHVTTLHGGGTYEAWIHNLDRSDLALAFVIFYQNDQQKEALYEVLSSIDIE